MEQIFPTIKSLKVAQIGEYCFWNLASQRIVIEGEGSKLTKRFELRSKKTRWERLAIAYGIDPVKFSSIVASDTRPVPANVVKISNRPRMKNDISIEIKGVLPFEKGSSLSCFRSCSLQRQ
nr:hypothetical protein Iba_chr10dCG15210 [Ipomoea batatas]